ncbi:radical SAM protein [Candidatus Saganbacteria bacterium]|nr:radical SAM protein [Candidatus Saganbacteria bacterium]
MKISSICPHFGEEPMISGTKGSGTIFFSGCTMRCVYCQNYQISQGQDTGYSMLDTVELADEMIKLQDVGTHNINLVSPTQYAKQIAESLEIAKSRGLKIPIVYNTNGYDKVSVLKMFDGLVDIYLPDIKYSNDQMGDDYSGVKNYVERNHEAIIEMYRQVGNLVLDDSDLPSLKLPSSAVALLRRTDRQAGIATKGLLIRHLVLPNGIAGSFDSLKFIASISKDIWLSIMAQYNPCNKAVGHPLLGRRITTQEYQQVLNWAEELGFENVMAQEHESAEIYLPDFNKNKPFESSSDI